MKCLIEGCENEKEKRGLCSKHYRQWYRSQPGNREKERERERNSNEKHPNRRREIALRYYYNHKESERARHTAYLQTPSGRYSVAKSVARQRKCELELSMDDYFALINQGCVYCERPIETIGIGLDRMDNTKGYEIDNVQPCCHECNMIRAARLTIQEMHVVAKALKDFRTHTTSAP